MVKSAVAAKGETMRKIMKREMGSFMVAAGWGFFILFREYSSREEG